MPACDARYDVIFNDGSGKAPAYLPERDAVVVFLEERLPDVWGEPGKLVSARLMRQWAARGIRNIEYSLTGGKKMQLWVDGLPRRCYSNRRYLRWHVDEPDWIIPP